VVLKHLQSNWVQIQSGKTPHGLRFSFPHFPYLGLWAAPGADFVCIEPWCGIADSVDTNQQLTDKEGIVSLSPNEDFHVQWLVQFY
ncbi:MAG TPA: aldose 1-epimerase family protein, partial [Flavisolibacter sp.]|nr:aldose 1-epimerase family protein [Flavisolibacter sp.]